MSWKRPTLQGRVRSDGGVESGWGWRTIGGNPSFHHGEDYYWLTGDPAGSQRCYGVGPGRVISVWYSNSMGWETTILMNSTTRVRYCHTREPNVSVGDLVDADTFIAPMGATGTEARGEVHLHFEVWVPQKDWVRTDPGPYFASTPNIPQGDRDMRVIYNLDNPNDDTRRALIGELSFQVITAAQSIREGKLWGPTVNFTIGEWNAALDLVNRRRAALGLPVQGGGGGPIDFTPVLDAVAEVPEKTRAEFSKNPLN